MSHVLWAKILCLQHQCSGLIYPTIPLLLTHNPFVPTLPFFMAFSSNPGPWPVPSRSICSFTISWLPDLVWISSYTRTVHTFLALLWPVHGRDRTLDQTTKASETVERQNRSRRKHQQQSLIFHPLGSLFMFHPLTPSFDLFLPLLFLK